MPRLIANPTVVAAAGNKPKRIEEYAGHVNSGHSAVSVARMVSPGGWVEPGQRPEFEEITVVLKGLLRVDHEAGTLDVRAGQAVITNRGDEARPQSVSLIYWDLKPAFASSSFTFTAPKGAKAIDMVPRKAQ